MNELVILALAVAIACMLVLVAVPPARQSIRLVASRRRERHTRR